MASRRQWRRPKTGRPPQQGVARTPTPQARSPGDPTAPLAGEASQKLQKTLAQAGLGSRRRMEEWISAGRVTVNGAVARLGSRVGQGDSIEIDGHPFRASAAGRLPRVLVYHKPEGEIVSREDPGGRPSVFDRLPSLRGGKW